MAKGVDGRAKGTVRSKAEPWNERRVKNVSLGAKGGFRLKPVIKGQQLGRKANLACSYLWSQGFEIQRPTTEKRPLGLLPMIIDAFGAMVSTQDVSLFS